MNQTTWLMQYRRARCGLYSGTDFRAVRAKINRTSAWERAAVARASWLRRDTMSAHRKSLVLACIVALKPARPRLP